MKKKPLSRSRSGTRNAGPYRTAPYRTLPPRPFSPPAAPRRMPRKPDGPETPGERLAYTAAGALGTSLSGALLARWKWRPQTIATVLTALGAGIALRGDSPTIRSVGAGTMAAAGGQLSLMILEKNTPPPAETVATAEKEKKPSNAGELPPGALEAALERARARLAMTDSDDEYA